MAEGSCEMGHGGVYAGKHILPKGWGAAEETASA